MIKFFRHIRQSMINQNRTKKYLLYAIGEIILVVIGILIALQINNWNEERKLKQQEDTYYCKILEDLRADINNIDSTIVSLDKRQIAAKRLLTKLLKIQEDKTVILADYISALRSRQFFPTKAAINDITSSGKLENLKNETLKEAILDFYTNQNYALGVVDKNNDQLAPKVFQYQDYTDFGIQELPLYRSIYGEELQNLLKSTEWQKDPKSYLFRNLRDHMNMTLIICEREKDLLHSVKTSAIELSQLIKPFCKTK